jgi:hypothetical protein
MPKVASNYWEVISTIQELADNVEKKTISARRRNA